MTQTTTRPAFGSMAQRQPPANATAQQATDAMKDAQKTSQQQPPPPPPPATVPQTPQQKAVASLGNVLKSQFKAIESIVPKGVDPQRLARIALIEFQKNPLLMQCSIQSVVGCVLQAAMLGLEIGGSLGYCYMVPYKQKNGTYIAQFQVGYKGLAKKTRESGEIRHIDVGIVHQNDDYEFEKGLEPKCRVKFQFGQDRGPVIGYYACASFTSGGTCFEVMTKDQVLRFAKLKSKSFSNGPWQTDFDAMAIKTVFKQLSKWLPMNEGMEKAMGSDEKVLTDKVDIDVGMVAVDAEIITDDGERVDSETGEVQQ